MRTALIVIGLILFIAFVSVSFVLAEPSELKNRGLKRGGNHGGSVGAILRQKEKLELSDEQIEKIEAIHEKVKAAHKTANETAKNEVNAILTDAQKAKLDDLKQARETQGKQGRIGQRNQRDPQEIFDRIDTDSDGVISFEEFKAYSEQMRNRMRQRNRQGSSQRGPERRRRSF